MKKTKKLVSKTLAIKIISEIKKSILDSIVNKK